MTHFLHAVDTGQYVEKLRPCDKPCTVIVAKIVAGAQLISELKTLSTWDKKAQSAFVSSTFKMFFVYLSGGCLHFFVTFWLQC